MKKLGDGIAYVFATLGGTDADRVAQRTAIVHAKWKEAVTAVYKNSTQLVLDHINSVVIMEENGYPALKVYCDDSLIRSDLDARQEFLKMKLHELGENIETFTIIPSRFDMKARHPFRLHEEETTLATSPQTTETETQPPLSPEHRQVIQQSAEAVENDAVREALKRAMFAATQWEDPSNEKNHT